jgi:hypothetical protein
MRTAAWAAAGVGVAGLVGTALSFGVRQAAMSDLDTNCPNHASAPCDPSKHDAVLSDVHRGETASTLANVFAVVGIAGAAASVVLFTLSRSPSSQSAVVLTPTGFAATGSF